MQEIAKKRLNSSEAQRLWEDIIRLSKDAGLDQSWSVRAAISCFFLTVALFSSYYLAWSSTLSLTILYSAIISVLLSQLAFLGHNAGHEAISKKRHINKGFGQLCMTVLCGLAFEEWRDRHRAHHRFVQEDEVDPDMVIGFVASVTTPSKKQKMLWAQKLGRYQHYYVWILSLLFGHSQRLCSQWGAFRAINRYRTDCAAVILHYCLFLGLPLFLDISFSQTLLVYLLPATFLGPHLAAVFWVNHIGKPLVEKPCDLHPLEQQILTSRTIKNSPRLDWFFGGLNFQIEHHIFASIPSFRLRKMQRIIRPSLIASSLPYDCKSWPQAIVEVYHHFKAVARA